MNVLDKPQPPLPPKDRIYRESSWLETITFGLYKTKKYHRKDEQIRQTIPRPTPRHIG